MKQLKKVGMASVLGVVTLGSAFAATGTDSGLSDEEKVEKRVHPLSELSDEERIAFIDESLAIKIAYLNQIVETLDEDGVDTSEVVLIIEQFEEMQQFLAEVDLEETSKEELREAFFDLRPERESAKLVREIVRENLSLDEIDALKEEFKAEKEALREEYGLPERFEREEGEKRKHFKRWFKKGEVETE